MERERELRRLAQAQIQAFYDNIAKADVPAEWRPKQKHTRLFTKQCFEKAYEYIANHLPIIQGALLVHGVYCVDVEGAAFPTAHSWVELPGGIIFDGVAQEFYDQEDYLLKTRAKPIRKYTRLEVFRKAAETRRIDTWHPMREESEVILSYFRMPPGDNPQE